MRHRARPRAHVVSRRLAPRLAPGKRRPSPREAGSGCPPPTACFSCALRREERRSPPRGATRRRGTRRSSRTSGGRCASRAREDRPARSTDPPGPQVRQRDSRRARRPSWSARSLARRYSRAGEFPEGSRLKRRRVNGDKAPSGAEYAVFVRLRDVRSAKEKPRKLRGLSSVSLWPVGYAPFLTAFLPCTRNFTH